jgi:hypothetical protein
LTRNLFTLFIAALLGALGLAACGGNGDDNTGSVRFINATLNYGALDLYVSDTRQIAAQAEGTASSYLSLDAATQSITLKPAGTATTALTQSLGVASGVSYTLVAYNSGTKLLGAYLTDDKAAPTSGTAALRVFNGASEAGTVDVYVTATDADLANATATMSSVAGTSLGAYLEITHGTYRIRVTAAGDKTDLRLDIPSVTLADQQIATLMLSATSGGVLVNGMLLNQGGTMTMYPNTNARVRVVPAVTGNGSVDASTSAAVLSAGLQSPSVGNYVITPATLAGLSVKVNGVALDTSAVAATAGADLTLLVYGDAASPTLKALVDDNLPATAASATKLRLVNVVNGLGSTITLNADYLAAAINVGFGEASTPTAVTASTTMRLEATTPVQATPLYLATDVSLTAQKVYTLFMMGDAAAPIAVLRKDR